jgi:drug/metabolite transporter (DMT)-like permease
MMISPRRLILLVVLAMLAFAANSLFCRMALKNTAIDAASFTSIRIVSGALVLWLIVRLRRNAGPVAGSWRSAAALFAYAAAFSFAYVRLPAAVGALVLFCAVQVTMIGYGLWKGERMRPAQVAGFCMAIAGLVGLLAPGLTAPPPESAALMLGAGVAWGIYSLRGKGADKGSGDATAATAGNFLRAVPFAIVMSAAMLMKASVDTAGVLYAVASGGLASGLGYALWYTALPGLNATKAATIQLSVPVIAAAGGVLFLGEAITLRLLLGSASILGGIALVVAAKSARQKT